MANSRYMVKLVGNYICLPTASAVKRLVVYAQVTQTMLTAMRATPPSEMGRWQIPFMAMVLPAIGRDFVGSAYDENGTAAQGIWTIEDGVEQPLILGDSLDYPAFMNDVFGGAAQRVIPSTEFVEVIAWNN